MNFETNVKPIYPYNEWCVCETEFTVDNNYRNETIFALGNGYIGTRGTFEEAYPWNIKTGLEGNFINGFYESMPIRYGELGIGFPKLSQTMLNVANAKCIKLIIGDEEFSMLDGSISQYSRVLNLRHGILCRKLIWTSPSGKKIKIEMTRLVSLVNKHVMAIRYTVTPINFSGNIKFVSEINGEVENHTRDTNPLIDYGPYGGVLQTEAVYADGCQSLLIQKTKTTGLSVACAATHMLNNVLADITCTNEENKVSLTINTNINQGETVCLDKLIVYATSKDFPIESLQEETIQMLEQLEIQGFDALAQTQEAYMLSFWQNADVEIKGDEALQQGIRVNLFHVLQGAGRDGVTGMPAKGLTGEGYEGHYFWDTEMYMLPFFICTVPEIAKKLLTYRYNTLDQARNRAREMSHHKGALYPWRTINGNEASAYYPQGTAQYHINADIAYAVNQYVEITGDVDFLLDMGAEILLETARMWADLGAFTPTRGGKFCICDVTGPDEYTSIVDNNCYTNFMARENLLYAYNTANWMKKNNPQKFEGLSQRIGLDEEEPNLWKKAADLMYFPYIEDIGVYPQDDTYYYKKPIDITKIPKNDFSLLMHSHPLVIYRYRLSKQADLIMAIFLLRQKFTQEEKNRNFNFYETTTMHSSSLSPCIFSMVACDIGEYEKAYKYFSATSRLDLDDYHKNVYSGIHAANMAGTWMGITFGFAGMNMYDNKLSFRPYLPDKWQSYTFRLVYRGRVLKVSVNKEKTIYELLHGSKLTFIHCGRKITIEEGKNGEAVNG